jgi:malonate-semialdehyde dehydrogenase (acetylating)/methylmalonate-semialdehyde dehydrogenase
MTDTAAEVRTIGHLIGGDPVEPGGDATSPVFDPARGVEQARVGLGGASEVGAAVDAASLAFTSWRRTSITARTKLLFAFRELVVRHADDIAATITAEHGKVLDDARGEVARAIENIEYACGAGEILKGSVSRQASTGVDVTSVRQPLGVVAGITPFNFPAMVPLWMIPNAVACGNTFVLKPSPRDPSAPMLLADLFAEAGFPDGVLNVVNGGEEAVGALLDHPEVRAVSFVGSTPVARIIRERGTAGGKRVQALGGAKNHMVVLPDADVDQAADAAVSAGFGSAGERCMAISVVVAVGAVADPLVAAIRTRMADLKVGDGREDGVEMGPLVTDEHRDRVAGYLGADAEAEIVVDGRDLEVPGDGFFLGPSLLDRVTPDMAAYRDEIFGPVLSVVRVPDYPTAMDLLEANPWGNGAAVFTRDGGAARRFEEDADAGMIGVNVPIPVPVGYHSFGGWKDSLLGDITMYGPEGIRFYTRAKVVTSRWPDPGAGGVDLGFPTTS